MRVPVPRPVRRALRLMAAVATILALLLAAMPAAAGDIRYYWAPTPNVFGWYSSASVTIQLRVFVDGIRYEPDDGEYDERLVSVDCDGPGVSGGYTGDPIYQDTFVNVRVDGPTAITGASVYCSATFQRQYYYDCWDFISHWCNDIRPFEDYEYSRAYFDRVFLDNTPPTDFVAFPHSEPNAAGWYNTPGTVAFSARDDESAILTCTTDVPFGGISSTITQLARGSCTNHAGLVGYWGFTYQYDDVPPTLAPTVTPSIIPLNGTGTASPNASDAHSRVKSQSCDPLDTSTVGVHSVTCRATDNADNTATATASYTVGYAFSGFGQPVDPSARNTAKAGRSIPLKWRVTDAAGAPVTNLGGVSVTATSLSCAAGTTDDQIEEYASGASGLQNLGDGSYQFNWSTPKSYAGSCKTLRLDLGDGIVHTAEFEFTK